MSASVVIVFGFPAKEQGYNPIHTEDTIRKMADDAELKWNQDNFGEEEEENEDKNREEKKGKNKRNQHTVKYRGRRRRRQQKSTESTGWI